MAFSVKVALLRCLLTISRSYMRVSRKAYPAVIRSMVLNGYIRPLDSVLALGVPSYTRAQVLSMFYKSAGNGHNRED